MDPRTMMGIKLYDFAVYTDVRQVRACSYVLGEVCA